MMLYDTRLAPNPRRVRMFLAEKGIEVPTIQVDLGRLEQKTDAFRALNPSLQTPVLLLDDGTALSESIAICRYFEELHPTPALFGVGALERAMVEMWQRRIEFWFLLSVQHVFRHTHPAMATMEPVQIKDIAELYRPRVMSFLKMFDTELKERAFAAGNNFSVADITAFVSVEFMKRARIEAPAELVHLAAWRARVAARPSAAA